MEFLSDVPVAAIVGPVIVFVTVVIAAKVFYDRRRARATVERRVRRSSIGPPLDEVAKLARKYYEAQGHDVFPGEEPGETSVSEIVVVAGSVRHVVRCERADGPVGPEAVSLTHASRQRHQAARATLIAPAGFRPEAETVAKELDVELKAADHVVMMGRFLEGRR